MFCLLSPVSKQRQAHIGCFLILIIDLSVPLNLNQNFTLKYVFSKKIHLFELLKSVSRGDGDVFRATVLWLCFKLLSCLFGNIRDTSVMHEKAKFVCFNYMQPQKVKFKSVQINMKHVSYYG